MSYILEALKKSERERQLKQAPLLPTLIDNHMPQRRRWLPWAITGLLLTVNIAVLAYFGLGQRQTMPPVSAVAEVPADPKLGRAEPVQPSKLPPDAAETANRSADQPQKLAKPDRFSVTPPVARRDAKLPAAIPIETKKPFAAAQKSPQPNKPAAPARRAPEVLPQAIAAPEIATESESIPLLSTMPAGFQQRVLPISVNVLAYAQAPQERFAVINMSKYVKGDQLPSGAVLAEIRSDSVVLELDGKRFRITQR